MASSGIGATIGRLAILFMEVARGLGRNLSAICRSLFEAYAAPDSSAAGVAHSAALSNFQFREVDFKRRAAEPLAATAKAGAIDPALEPRASYSD